MSSLYRDLENCYVHTLNEPVTQKNSLKKLIKFKLLDSYTWTLNKKGKGERSANKFRKLQICTFAYLK
jgi:hypothetical protein